MLLSVLNPGQFKRVQEPSDWEDEPPGKEGYFHGSKHLINEGENVVPGYTIGQTNYDYDDWPERSDLTGQHEHVYMTGEEAEAESWAGGGAPGEHRRYTYRVDPGPFVQQDTDTMEAQYTEGGHYVAPEAKVLERIDIPKPTAWNRPVQGTLAPYDWQQSIGRQQFGEGLKYVNAPTHKGEGNPAAEEWGEVVRAHRTNTSQRVPLERQQPQPQIPGEQQIPGSQHWGRRLSPEQFGGGVG